MSKFTKITNVKHRTWVLVSVPLRSEISIRDGWICSLTIFDWRDYILPEQSTYIEVSIIISFDILQYYEFNED